MIVRNLYFLDGILFATGYQRIVYGGRGDYVELSKENIILPLKSHFHQSLPSQITNELFYYYWLEPIGRSEKIYWQCRKVNYADYRIGFYYITPKLLIPFKTVELF